jgi:hypothetical protein
MILASRFGDSVRRNATSSSARSTRAGTPLGGGPAVGGRIVLELCIRMITTPA